MTPTLRKLVEPIWLGLALERARSVDAPNHDRLAELARAALRRHRAARALSGDESDVAALSLEREAFCYAVAALRLVAGETVDGAETPSASWQALERLLADGKIGRRAELEPARATLASDDALGPDALSPRDARRARLSTERAVGSLVSELEWRTPRALVRARWLRSVTLAVALVAGSVFFFWLRHYTDNVARFKLPAASGVERGSQPVAVLTDGDIGPDNVLHVRPGDSPWASVDLLGPFRLGRVIVHPGIPSAPDMLPLVLELSDDNEHWSKVATRKAPLDERAPWIIELNGRSARWLRVQHTGRGSLALSEIEAYAQR